MYYVVPVDLVFRDLCSLASGLPTKSVMACSDFPCRGPTASRREKKREVIAAARAALEDSINDWRCRKHPQKQSEVPRHRINPSQAIMPIDQLTPTIKSFNTHENNAEADFKIPDLQISKSFSSKLRRPRILLRRQKMLRQASTCTAVLTASFSTCCQCSTSVLLVVSREVNRTSLSLFLVEHSHNFSRYLSSLTGTHTHIKMKFSATIAALLVAATFLAFPAHASSSTEEKHSSLRNLGRKQKGRNKSSMAMDMGNSMSSSSELPTHTLRVNNLAFQQPLSPFFVMVHTANADPLYQFGEMASEELATLAEDGNAGPLVDKYLQMDGVCQAEVRKARGVLLLI